MLLSTVLPVLALLLPAYGAPAALHDTHDHEHTSYGQLPSEWYQPEDSSVHQLFRRAPGDGTAYPPVGSDQWRQGWPDRVPDVAHLPQAWLQALDVAVKAGKIPDIPQTTGRPNTNPIYQAPWNPNSPEVCSSSYHCRGDGDLWDAPNGTYAASFDDGPFDTTPQLLDFLQSHNEKVTHFMIGTNILAFPAQFQRAFDLGHDIAVHTWSHPYMTTLNNQEVLGQIGWSMQIIRNSTGGRVPRFWRPPYGDADNRIRAIAKEVFGLTTVIWNQDTSDWALGTGGITLDEIGKNVNEWLSRPKNPGMMILHHEVTADDVQAFINSYPAIKSNGWNFVSLATILDGRTYQNARSSTSDDVVLSSIVGSHPPKPDDDKDKDDDEETETPTPSPTETSASAKITSLALRSRGSLSSSLLAALLAFWLLWT